MVKAPESDNVGARLRNAREQRGMSLRQVAATTKISIATLEALERNDLARLPGGIFSRAFVRAYATSIGLDPDEMVADFVRASPRDSAAAEHPGFAPAHSEDFQGDVLESRRHVSAIFVGLAAVSLPIAGLLVYLGRSAGSQVAGQVTPSAVSLEASRPSEPSPAASLSEPGFSLQLSSSRPTRIAVSVDSEPMSEVTLDAGARRVFSVHDEVRLTLRDAGAIQWTINGVAGRPLGLDGESATIRVTTENYGEFLGDR